MGACPLPDERAKGNTTNEATKTATTGQEKERQHQATNSQQNQAHQQQTRRHQPTKADEKQRATTATLADRDRGQKQQNPKTPKMKTIDSDRW